MGLTHCYKTTVFLHLLILAWALQQCSASALPVICCFLYCLLFLPDVCLVNKVVQYFIMLLRHSCSCVILVQITSLSICARWTFSLRCELIFTAFYSIYSVYSVHSCLSSVLCFMFMGHAAWFTRNDDDDDDYRFWVVTKKEMCNYIITLVMCPRLQRGASCFHLVRPVVRPGICPVPTSARLPRQPRWP